MTGLAAQVRRQSTQQAPFRELDDDAGNTNLPPQTNHRPSPEQREEGPTDALGKLENEMSNAALRRRAFIRCALYVFGYVCLGWIFFGAKYEWSWVSACLDQKCSRGALNSFAAYLALFVQVDCAYFAMVTVTTTGYGDLTPRDQAEDHVFTIFYAFLGVAFISLVGKERTMVVARTVKETAKQMRRKAVKATTMLLAADDDDLALKTQAVTQESSLLRALLTAKAI